MVDALLVVPPATMTAAASGALTQSVFQTTAGGNLILNAPGSNRLKGKGFAVQVSGYVSGGAGTYTATIQPILYGDASLATVTTKPLFSASAGTLAYTGVAAAGLTLPWSVSAEFEGDTLSGSFLGIAQSNAGVTLKTQTITVAPVSAINFATEPPIKFAVGITTGGSLGAAPKLVVTEFYLRADNE